MKQKLTFLLLTLLVTTITIVVAQNTSIPFKVFPEENGDHDGEHQYPQISGSIAVSDDTSNLESLAIINKTQAESFALGYTTGGQVISTQLEEENGFLVWNVVVEFDGVQYQISVDAGNGTILWTSNDSQGE